MRPESMSKEMADKICMAWVARLKRQINKRFSQNAKPRKVEQI